MPAQPTLVLDFDGTLCLGDDPVYLFADELAKLVDDDGAARVRAQLASFLAGELPIEGAEDGYHALYYLGKPLEVDPQQVAAAYYRSRERMEAGEGSVYAPEGILDLLDDVAAAGARIVLVTNAPVTGAMPWLERVGIAQHLGEVIADAGKPQRMADHLRTLLRTADAADSPHLLASVGDVWANDVEPAMLIGARGFHIDRFGTRRSPSTASAPDITALYPAIRAWAAEASSA